MISEKIREKETTSLREKNFCLRLSLMLTNIITNVPSLLSALFRIPDAQTGLGVSQKPKLVRMTDYSLFSLEYN